MRSCAVIAACAVLVVSSRALGDDEAPAYAYRHRAFAITSGFGVAFPFVAQGGWNGFSTNLDAAGPVGLVAIDASFRAIISGMWLGAELGVTFMDRVTTNAIVSPGLTAGFVIPLLPRLAFSTALHTIFIVPTAPGSSADLQITGELSLEIFFGRHAFIEPVFAVGDFHRTDAGARGMSYFVVGTGYRLGVVF